MPMRLCKTPICDQRSLEDFCQRAHKQAFVTVDTEFVRERSYYPMLCLVQVATSEEAVVIDPLAMGLSLEPLFALMQDPLVLKVFHAARQDLEIFFQLSGKLPVPLFDSQVAAMVCGYGEQVGYETLVCALTDKSVDKSNRYSDWSKRPLHDEQLDYALSDVTHLRQIYQKLSAQLVKNKRDTWVQEEMEILSNPNTYQVDVRKVWRKLKGRGDKPRFLALLRELAAEREIEAQRLNIPRGHLLSDNLVRQIAVASPQDQDALIAIRGLSKKKIQSSFGQKILNAIKVGQNLPFEQCPDPRSKNNIKTPEQQEILSLLKLLLHHKCKQHDVAPKLVASSSELRALIMNESMDLPLLQGWRHSVFGQDALDLLKGHMQLCVQQEKLTFHRKEMR